MVSSKTSSRTTTPKRHTPARPRASRAAKAAPAIEAVVVEPAIDELIIVEADAVPLAIEVEPPKKQKKQKVVRDSFTMPGVDHERLGKLKKRCLAHGLMVKKSELLRAGLHLLDRLDDMALLAEIGRLENVRTGRPNNHELVHRSTRKDGKKPRKRK